MRDAAQQSCNKLKELTDKFCTVIIVLSRLESKGSSILLTANVNSFDIETPDVNSR